jgi:hypothetical protein
MNHTMLNAVSVMNRCARFIAVSVFSSKVLGSILRISKMRLTALSRTYVNVLGAFGTLSARSHQGFNSRLKGVARVLAVVIGLSLSIASIDRSEASIVPNKKLRELANYQLPDNQYKCHNEIVQRESSWNINAIGNKSGTKQTHGYYQIKSDHVKGKPYDYQFFTYWYYVSSRYSFDKNNPEIPDYCSALHHLRTKGWQ